MGRKAGPWEKDNAYSYIDDGHIHNSAILPEHLSDQILKHQNHPCKTPLLHHKYLENTGISIVPITVQTGQKVLFFLFPIIPKAPSSFHLRVLLLIPLCLPFLLHRIFPNYQQSLQMQTKILPFPSLKSRRNKCSPVHPQCGSLPMPLPFLFP